jgi:O-antigen/teichoic acid export membrane protein
MGRTKRFISGVSLGYLSQLTVMLTGLWLTPFLLGHAGRHDYGLWLVGLQVLAYVGLVDVGVVALLPRETAFVTGRRARGGDRAELARLVGETARLVFWQTPLAATVAAAIWLSLPADWAALRAPLGLALAGVVLFFPCRIFQAVLQGLQDWAFVTKAHTGAWLAGLCVTVLLVVEGFGLYGLVGGGIATQAVAAAACWLRLRRRFPEALPRRLPRLDWPTARTRLRQGFLVTSSQVAQLLIVGTDLLVIGKLLGPAAVVPYACTAKLAGVLANQPQHLLQTAGPALSELKESESQERVAAVCAALGQAMLLASGAVVCVTLAVNRGFVTWWVGAENYGGTWLTTFVLLNLILRHWCLTVAAPLTFFGRDRHVAQTVLLDGVLTFAVTLLAVHLLGATAAPLGSIAGVCLVSLPYHLKALARETGETVWQTLGRLRPWAWRFGLLAAGAAVAAGLWVPATAAALALTAGAAGAAYAVVMLPLLARAPMSNYVPARVAGLIAKFINAPAPGEAAAARGR